ncbi:MAG: sigma-70 family RNA polymerase sigma factor [Ruminococcaceae bacterium]|nr:sigma-70 family RNA polymerase sigma factor [Oscillospiraceae bacterium]
MQGSQMIVQKVYAAKKDNNAADDLILQYMGFIKSETSKFTGRICTGNEDEFSISMFAFYEAIVNYDKNRGNFIAFASMAIKNRLIDYSRKEKRHDGNISIYVAPDDDSDEQNLLDTVPEDSNVLEYQDQKIAEEEILEFEKQLTSFGVSLSDVADNSPKQQRTLESCHKALRSAYENREVMDKFIETKRLPLAELTALSGVDRKTLERHRRYLVAILLAYSNGYEIIRGHLNQIFLVKRGEIK